MEIKKNNPMFIVATVIWLLLFVLTGSANLLAQGVGINLDNSAPDNAAILDVKSNSMGLLMPRMNDAQRNAIPSPAVGLFIYNTSTNKINYYKSTGWYELSRTFQSSSTGTNSPGGGVSINIAGTAPNTSSILDVNSSTQGLLFPRTNSGSLTATTGLIYYDITLNKLMYYNGTSWKSICETFITTTTGPGSLAPNGVAVNTNGDAPDPSAILDLKSDSKGLLIPRMTSIERSQILPVNGLLVYNTSDNTIDYYNGSDWNKLETDVPSAAGTISGSSSVCQGQNGITFSVSAITGATGYTWSYSGTGFSIATGNNTNSITANFSGTSTSGDLTVYGTNACGNGSVSVAFSITVNALPAQPGVITGTTPVCAGSIENYSISPVAGATSYTWSVPTGATFSNQTTNSGVLYASNSVSTTGIGTVAWSNPGNATTNNASYATASLNNTQSNWLVATGFGFSIPSDATINGIMVEWEQKSSSGTNSLDNAIRIVKNGSIGITDKSNATQWGTSNDVYTPSYGNSSDLWGETWSPADINSANFGAALSAKRTTTTAATFSVDAVRITVYYTLSAAITVSWGSSTGGNVSVAANNACGTGPARNFAVTISSPPTISISGTTTICPGASTTLTASGGISYLWSTSETTPAITVSPATTTTYTVTATNAAGCTNQASKTVTPTFICETCTLYDIDGNAYTTKSIGSQCWMKENLKTTKYKNGTAILNLTLATDWEADLTGAYACYNNNCGTYNATYGKLYNGYAAVNANGICPTGWHVPTDAEWCILENFLDPGCDPGCNIDDRRGVHGGYMKEAGTVHWNTPNDGATNSSGFTGLPAGRRSDTGTFTLLSLYALFWSTTNDPVYPNTLMYRNLSYLEDGVFRTVNDKKIGNSIRCVKD